MREPRHLIAVALDFAEHSPILSFAHRLAAETGYMKIGLEAFVSLGPSLVKDVVDTGVPVFLDLKLHDIPNTVKGASAAAARTGAAIFNVHASGGRDMMKAALEGAHDAAARAGGPRPKVIGVTVLTSLDKKAVHEIGWHQTPAEAALRLAVLARETGLDGAVCSPEEVTMIRKECGESFFLIVPGVRPAGAERGDQSRVATPEAATRAGADLLVIGRPITQAADPVEAARAIAREIERGLTPG